MEYLKIKNNDYGNLLPYIQDENITDINWNGYSLWIDDLKKGRYKVDTLLTKEFINVFCQKISNSVNCNFNKYDPLLEGETDDLRISILHEKVANTGHSISIRKTPSTRRIDTKNAIKDGYCTQELIEFIKACVKANMSIIVCGVPGTGKTEFVKYLTQYIPENQRVITIEDTLELRYHAINPSGDSIEIKVDEEFAYPDAIKSSLRQRPDWLLLSETRGREAIYLLESTSTGISCMTTLHTDTVTKIPDRLINMMGIDGKEKEDNIYSFFDIGVLVTRVIDDDNITRKITEVCLFDREDGKNSIQMLYVDGKFIDTKLPLNFIRKFKEKQINNPLEKTEE